MCCVVVVILLLLLVVCVSVFFCISAAFEFTSDDIRCHLCVVVSLKNCELLLSRSDAKLCYISKNCLFMKQSQTGFKLNNRFCCKSLPCTRVLTIDVQQLNETFFLSFFICVWTVSIFFRKNCKHNRWSSLHPEEKKRKEKKMVLCQVIRVSSTVGVSALTKFVKFNANTKYLSSIRQFSASSALLTGKTNSMCFFSPLSSIEVCIKMNRLIDIRR